MKTNTSGSHSPASASMSASLTPFSPEIAQDSSFPSSAARYLEAKPSLPNGRARSRVNGHGNHASHSHAHAQDDAAAQALASQTEALNRSSFSDATFVRSVLTSDLRAGIALCRRARLVLQGAAVRSFDAGGMELDPVHLRLLLDCAQMCEMTADFMSRNSPYHLYLCEVCAAICEACAESCALAGSMEECAAICQECIVVCRALAG
jgi:hypothetical protein